jgi:hypothetical protein
MGTGSNPRFGKTWRKTFRICRGGIALAVAYAFVIQAMLFGSAGARFATTDHGVAGFELCLTGSADGASLPGGPAAPDHQNHCIFCFAGAHHLAAGNTGLSHAAYVDRSGDAALATATDIGPHDALAYAIARSRGPPISA